MADVIVNHVSRRRLSSRTIASAATQSPFAGHVSHLRARVSEGARAVGSRSRCTRLVRAFRSRKYETAHGPDAAVDDLYQRADRHRCRSRSRRGDISPTCSHRLHAAGIRAIRLDAVGHAVKKAGTSCFMIPETFAFIADLTAQAHARAWRCWSRSTDTTAIRSTWRARWTGSTTSRCHRSCCTRSTPATSTPLLRWLEIRPRNAVTVLDTHDGIGVLDVDAGRGAGPAPGLLPRPDIEALVDDDSRAQSWRAAGWRAATRPATWTRVRSTARSTTRSAGAIRSISIARAIQCFVPGVPQIYYVGLLAGVNDLELLRRSGVGRDVNRHHYTAAELQRELTRPVVQSLLALLRLRNTHAAFAGNVPGAVAGVRPGRPRMGERCGVRAPRRDLAQMRATIACSGASAAPHGSAAWDSTVEV